MRYIVALMRQREYFVQAIHRTTCVTSLSALDQTNLFKVSNFFTTLISSTKSTKEKCSVSDGEEEPDKCLSLRIEKLPKGLTVGSALQSWMGDGFPVHGGDIFHAINRLRKLGRNKRALELMEWVIRERPYRLGELEYSYLLEFTVKLHGVSQGEKLFTRVPQEFQNELLYNNLVIACLDQGAIRLALEYMKKMRELGYRTSHLVYNRLIIRNSTPGRRKLIAKDLALMKADKATPRQVRYFVSYRRFQKPSWMMNPVVFYSDSSEKKGKVAPLQETRMRDRFTLYARGGEGGSGCSSIRRSRADRYGKPDGGNGGRGGDVILECTHAVWDFSGLQPHIKGGKAGHGTSKNRIGNRGDDKIMQVPIGTVIHLQEGEIPSQVENESPKDLDPWDLPGSLVEDLESEKNLNVDQENMPKSVRVATEKESLTSHLGIPKEAYLEDEEGEVDQIRYNVAELTEQGQRIIIARGGEGGLGNVCATRYVRGTKYAKSTIRQSTLKRMKDDDEEEDERSSIKAGSLGSEAVVILELKSIADVGLVGLPNAGKSTLLGALSRAKPRVGHYAFTTLRPNLGNVNYEDFSMTVADIPGLIKGAHENRGLGHNFLRHIERTKVLAYVVDLASGLDGCKGVTPWQQLRDLVMELEFHEEGLSDRSSLIVANKIDEDGADERLEELKTRVKGVKIYPVCAVLEEGVAELKDGLKMLVDGDGEPSERLRLGNICID